MEIISHNIGSISDLINQIKLRPAMYIGDEKLSSLSAFIDGFYFALTVNNIQIKENEPISFGYFHEWVSNHYKWYESTAGWCYIILKENNNDEENSLRIFFELFDKFSQIKVLSIQQMKLNQQSIDFHYSDECETKRIADVKLWTKEPLYKSPTKVNLLELSDFGFVYNVVDVEKNWERTIYKTEIEAKKQVENLFGNFSDWIQLEKTAFDAIK